MKAITILQRWASRIACVYGVVLSYGLLLGVAVVDSSPFILSIRR